jgi:adenosylcobinamide-phosphate synthase
MITLADADRLLLLVAGLAIDALSGDMPAIFRHVPHPMVPVGRGIAFFDRKLNRKTRSEVSRRDRGIITVMLSVGGVRR